MTNKTAVLDEAAIRAFAKVGVAVRIQELRRELDALEAWLATDSAEPSAKTGDDEPQNSSEVAAAPSSVKAQREIRGWSQPELATRAGLTESTIIRAERTQPPPIQMRNLEKIARAFDVPVSTLFGATPSDNGPALSEVPDSGPPSDVPDSVLLIHDLAYKLGTTVRRIRAVLKSEPWKLPERLPKLDQRDRWARVAVEKWLEWRGDDHKRRTSAAFWPDPPQARGRAARQ